MDTGDSALDAGKNAKLAVKIKLKITVFSSNTFSENTVQ
jgi:hypothetical protein